MAVVLPIEVAIIAHPYGFLGGSLNDQQVFTESRGHCRI